MKRRVLGMALALTMVFGCGLAGCGNTDAGSTSDSGEGNRDSAGSDAAGTQQEAESGTEAADTGNAGDDTQKQNGEPLKIGFSTTTLGAEFFAVLDDELRAYAEGDGNELITVSCEGNAATQVSDIENLISMDCDVIGIFAVDPAALEDICAQAVAEGIRVYPIATTFENRDAFTCIIGGNQYGFGEDCARLASEWIDETFPDAEDGTIEVAVIGNTQSQEAIDRTTAMYSIEDMNPKVKIVGRDEFDLSGVSTVSTKSQEFADIIISKYPDVKAVLCYGVDVELGANEAFMRDSNLDREHFGLFGVDTSQVAYEQIKLSVNNESLIRGTVNLGDNLALSIYRTVTGQMDDLADENGYISEAGVPVNASNVDEFLQ